MAEIVGRMAGGAGLSCERRSRAALVQGKNDGIHVVVREPVSVQDDFKDGGSWP